MCLQGAVVPDSGAQGVDRSWAFPDLVLVPSKRENLVIWTHLLSGKLRLVVSMRTCKQGTR